MFTEEDRATRLAVVRRIAVAMADRSDDPVLAKTQILTKSSFVGNPKTIEELDGRNPVATQSDGGRYYPHVRMDGRGQIDIVWPSGVEMTYKFFIPEDYLKSEATASPIKPKQSERSQAPITPPASPVSSQLDQAIERIWKVDASFPLSIAHIPTFPFKRFDDMKAAIQSRTFAIARFSFQQDSDMLRLIDPASSSLHTGSTLATFLVPLICLVLAFTVSAWFLLGLLYFFVGTRVTTSIWSSAILRAAHKSESAFCLLFYGSKINCYDLKSHTEYEWQLIQTKV